MIYLINDPAKAGKTKGGVMAKRPVPKGWRSWKAYMAHIRGMRRGARRNDPGPARKARRNDPGPARRPRYGVKHKVYRRNPRNPMAGLPGRLFAGAVDAVEVVGGKIVARTVPSLVSIERDSTTGLIVQALAGAAVGVVGSYVNPNAGKMLMAGGLAAPLETLIKKANLPYVSAALGEEDETVMVSAYPEEIAAFPETAYPAIEGVGADDEEAYAVQQ